ncbi:hypothetical protein [Nocardia sp. X0981]
MTGLHSDRSVTTALPGLTGEKAREWRQFVRWARATDQPALPGGGYSAAVTLSYLEENSGTSGMRRNRVTALNAAHHLMGWPAPGDAEPVRRALNPERAARLSDMRAQADPTLRRLPTTSWPEGLWGRRDAVILLLGTAGLRWAQIANLTQNQIRVTHAAVTVGAQPLVELPATGEPETCPVAVFRRWQAILAHAPEPRGHLIAERILTGAEGDDPELLEAFSGQPYLTEFDACGIAHGYIGELDPLPAETIATITLAAVRPCPAATAATALDPNYYQRGIAARHRAQPLLHELDDILDRIEALPVPAVLDFPPGAHRPALV